MRHDPLLGAVVAGCRVEALLGAGAMGAAYLASGESRKGEELLDAAVAAFDRRVRMGADEPFTRYYAAAAHALKGDLDTALAFLERAAMERRAFTLARARIEPEFERLHSDVRFQRLLSVSATF